MNISIETQEKLFLSHIQKKGNNRIIISGKYGTGKSYFIRNTFKNNYNVFFLSPINYVVGVNQDIFEWIKIDIAKNILLEYFIEQDKETISNNFLLQSYLFQNMSKIFTSIISKLINKSVKCKTGISPLNDFNKTIDDFTSFKSKAIEALQSDQKGLELFIQSELHVKGSIFEDNLTTQVLRTSIEVIKIESAKENVLIIDDLDRLDPDHIFRILNILSAHNDHFDKNKFGFDKVILICDIENLLHLYQHRYGVNADFEGYIEKFFTYEPFLFSIDDDIINFCENELKFNNIDSASTNILSLLLIYFVKNKILKIRNLRKILTDESIDLKHLPIMEYEANIKSNDFNIQSVFIHASKIKIDYNSFSILKVIYFLSLAFGGIYNLQKTIKNILNNIDKLQNDSFDIKYLPDIFNSLCIISHISKKHRSDEIFYNWHELSDNIYFKNLQMDIPRVTFLSTNFQLPLKWSRSNQYEDGDYFKDSNPLNGLRTFASEKEKTAVCNYAKLFTEIHWIVNFVITKKILNNM